MGLIVDIESILFTELATALRAAFPSPQIFVTGEAVSAPATFPCASIVEKSNTTYDRTLDSANKEHHARLLWQFDFYSNLTSGKKTQCKAMATVVDNIMIGYNFTRTFFEPVDNVGAGIYRMAARYTAVAGTNKQIYRR